MDKNVLLDQYGAAGANGGFGGAGGFKVGFDGAGGFGGFRSIFPSFSAGRFLHRVKVMTSISRQFNS